jgi:hypothetical protein
MLFHLTDSIVAEREESHNNPYLFALLHFGKIKHNQPPFQMKRRLALF